MRDIKFRVWEKPCTFPWEDFPGRMSQVDLYFFEESGAHTVDELHASVVLMQFIGVRDRDGTEIYEGDIYAAWSGGSHRICIVTWGVAGWFLRMHTAPQIWHFSGGERDPGKVIGNIWEHPELMPEGLR